MKGVDPRAAGLFVLSGAAALGLETACFRACGLLFGATHAAAGAVLASFMGGLAAGAALGARAAPSLRGAQAARGYALCEALVGAWALALPALLPRAQELAAGAGPAGRVALAFALLAPGTLAMGATTPLLAQASLASRAALRTGLARLYSANLLGGALGALAAGFALLPALGLAHTMHAGGALAVTTGALAFGLLGSGAKADESPVESQGISQWVAAPMLASVGLVSFALQVAQHRVFALLLGSAAYTFALVTAVTLLALALGGRAVAREGHARDRASAALDEDPLWARAARRLLWVAIAAWLGQLVVRVAPAYLRASVVAGSSPRAVGLARAVLVALVVGAPAYQIGALFPSLAARVPGRSAGRAAGIASLSSTAGNVGGALLAGFVLIPALGVQRAMELPAALALGLAVAAAALAGPWSLRSLLVSGTLAALFAMGVRGRWDPVALSAGAYRVAANRALARGDSTSDRAPCGPERTLRGNRVLYARDGALGTVVVLAHGGGDDCTLYSLRVDGKAEGSAFVRGPVRARIGPGDELYSTGDLPSEILAGWLPVAASVTGAATREAFVVGWGTGLSARALLDAGAARVTSAELEPAVLEAARVFDERALADPRVRLVRDDARMALRRESLARYDVIVSHPSNPWVTGASALFSVEYFSLVRARLAPLGRAVAWVQLYETDREAVRALVHTFGAVFPYAFAFRPGPSSRDLFLIGSAERGALPADAEGFARAFARWQSRATPDGARLLAWLGTRDATEVTAMLRATPGALRAWTAGAQPLRDDSAALEYRVADRLLAGASPSADELLAGLGR